MRSRVHRETLLPVLRRDFGEPPGHRDPGVRNDSVNSSERKDRLMYEPVGHGPVGEIAGHGNEVGAEAYQRFGGLVKADAVAVTDADMRADPPEGQRGFATDAGTGTGDHDDTRREVAS